MLRGNWWLEYKPRLVPNLWFNNVVTCQLLTSTSSKKIQKSIQLFSAVLRTFITSNKTESLPKTRISRYSNESTINFVVVCCSDLLKIKMLGKCKIILPNGREKWWIYHGWKFLKKKVTLNKSKDLRYLRNDERIIFKETPAYNNPFIRELDIKYNNLATNISPKWMVYNGNSY